MNTSFYNEALTRLLNSLEVLERENDNIDNIYITCIEFFLNGYTF